MNQFVFLVPIFSWLAALWIALGLMFSKTDWLKREKISYYLSLISSGLALLLLLVIDIVALFSDASSYVVMGEWFSSGQYVLLISFLLNPSALAIATLFTLIAFLTIHFSANYMHREKGFHRFFMVINLFIGAMSLIILGGNLVMVFVGWELAGISSYLLIGYVMDRPLATKHATRALVTNRIGDAGLILAMFLLFAWVGTTEWTLVTEKISSINHFTTGLIALSLLIAASAKSAVVPFSPWITKALEGPTPSSTLFYGTLMVHAGVYLLTRMEAILVQSPVILLTLCILGVLTVLYGWLSGLVQSDIKGSLMFSTTMHIGLMFLWCGLGWFDFALWHLGLHTSWRAFQFYFSPSILQLANRHADVVPDWLSKNDWLYNAAVQRLWVEQFGDAMMAAPIKKLAEDAQIFEKKVVEPFIGLPEQTHAVSSMADWEDKLAGIRGSSSNIGKGEGLFGFFLETVAGAMHWFEENWVLRGSGEGLLNFLQRLGTYLTHIDYLICQPRYLLIMIILTFIIIV